MNKIHIITLGCPKNTADSGHLSDDFLSEGFVSATDAESADIILVNTCGFIRDAKEESIEEILRLAKIKKIQNSKFKIQNDKKLLVFGCLAQRYRDELLKEIPEIDGLWGVGADAEIIKYCKGLKGSRVRRQASGAKRGGENELVPSSYAYLKIAEGCDKKCTFCVIPSIRGNFRSMPSEKILKEAEGYVRKGVRELILVAQDITNYGKEADGYNLVSLLKDMTSISGDFHIRLLYLYPTALNDELLECIAAGDKIYKYIDIPLQHSEDRLLRLMGRRGSRREYIKLLRTVRRRIPQIALRTTFIVGFPTETEEDFNGLADFIEEIRFDRLGVFKFSKEEGTPSAKLKGQVPEKVKDRRLDEIMRRQALISLEKNRELIGRRYSALVDEIDGNLVIARLYSHAPEIDGVVIIESNNEDGNSALPLKAGDAVTVEIIGAYDYDVKGRLVDDNSVQERL
ncbi:MAG: 30S ribosomal protein S12 methylthiotransferase RimO [Nitrospirae bacterium]|nr:30S ribosomal protein S12 methylthiotransferase RimO [Nitrospirota bacterium]MCL5237046.1 30S ribosomal protein S12 methylthiotransferase RimO [Nitrospirota bacterium]